MPTEPDKRLPESPAADGRSLTLAELTEAMHAFVAAKGWYDPASPRAQTPRNIATSLVIEAAEVLEHFQWGEATADPEGLAGELADVALYLFQLASISGIDLQAAILAKLAVNYGRSWTSRMIDEGVLIPDEEPRWPFSRPALMAGLRRYLDAPNLRLLDIRPMVLPRALPGGSPSPLSALRGMSVGVEIDGAERRLPLVLKEAPVSEGGRVLAAVGRREFGVYRRLAPHLPLLVPGLIAGDPAQGWIIVEALSGLRPPDLWTADDYREAIVNLAAMHDRFWGLTEDLAIFAWLARPFEADYEATIIAAAEAVRVLVVDEHIPALSTSRNFFFFGHLVRYADEIAAPLREEVGTLLHGDYWPGNIARPLDGRQVVFDWQRAGIGPAILDLVNCVATTGMMLAPALPRAEAIALYRAEMTNRVAPGWDDERFALLWDHALLWHFLTHWLGRLAASSIEDYDLLPPGFERVWLHPAIEALERRMHLTVPQGD